MCKPFLKLITVAYLDARYARSIMFVQRFEQQ